MMAILWLMSSFYFTGLSSFYNQLAMTSFLYQQQHQHQQLQSAVAAAQVAATSNQLLTSKTASLIDSSAVDSPLDLSPATDQLSLHVDGPSLRVPEVRPRYLCSHVSIYRFTERQRYCCHRIVNLILILIYHYILIFSF